LDNAEVDILMALVVEYYEVKTREGYEYYYMPVDTDAKNKENLDRHSHRIWKFNTRSNRITEIKNIREHKPQVDRADFFKIQLMAKSVPWDENYLFLQRMREYCEQHSTQESPTVDQV
jgi:hypothetical protein